MDELVSNLPEGITRVPDFVAYSAEGWTVKPGLAASEYSLTIYINSHETVSIMCTPVKLNCLAVGFLYASGIISGMNDIISMRVCLDDRLADIKIKQDYRPPMKRILTSGCGGGTAFKLTEEPVQSSFAAAPERLFQAMRQMQQGQIIYREAGGAHSSALAGDDELIIAEDIGRHNTIDKIIGECLLRKIETRDRFIITTGRITSEMVLKAARAKVPIVASRSSATDQAINLGEKLGIAVVAYMRGSSLSVCCCPERITGSPG